jgi:LETM1-like protein
MTTFTMRGLRTASLFQRIQRHPHGEANTQFRPSLASLLTLRCASTTPTVPAKGPRTYPVNGPSTTLPAPIKVPVREEGQSFFPSYALALGKAYIGFYKTGVKNIYTNFKLSRDIQHAIDAQHASSFSTAVSSASLTRSDLQLLVRNWHDIKRVPIFALVLMICGEFTPLVVIALSGIVPWTCRIPKQIESDRKKMEQRRSISFRELTTEPPTHAGVENLRRTQLLHISRSLGLSSGIWDLVGGLPTSLLRRNVRRRVEYLELDDSLIRKAGGIHDMASEEVKMALVERGVDVLGKGDALLKANLNAWLLSREKAPAEKLLLTRYELWNGRVIIS